MELNDNQFWPYFQCIHFHLVRFCFYIFVVMLSSGCIFLLYLVYIFYFYVSIGLEFWILWSCTFMYVFFIPYPWYLLFSLYGILIYVLLMFLHYLGVLLLSPFLLAVLMGSLFANCFCFFQFRCFWQLALFVF